MFYRKTNLLCLPDCILLMILEYIELKELLQVVNRICRRLNDLIVQCSSLWRIFDFQNLASINGEKLKGILKYSQGFERFLIGFWRIDCKIEKLNEIFQQGFYGSPNLYWMDLSNCQLSSLSFLPFVPNLQILCLAHCTNLVDKELKFLSQCKYLDQIDLSFTFITGREVIQHIVTNHNINLTPLDMRGTQVSVENCSSILKRFSETLLFFSINRPQFDTEKQHLEEIAANYSDCFISF